MDTWDLASLDVAPHQPKILRSDNDARAIAINLPAGQDLGDHEVHEHAYLMVAAGEVELVQGDETVSGGPGLLAHWSPHERHTVRATSDARLLLLLAPWPGDGHPGTRG